jgi:hypothetical protein
MQRCPLSWSAGSSDHLGLKAKSSIEVLRFLDNPDGKPFLFPDTHMCPDVICFIQNKETTELIPLALQSKVKAKMNVRLWLAAVNSLLPCSFYIMVVSHRHSIPIPMTFNLHS